MRLEFDKAKSNKNSRERGLPFEMVELFEFDTAIIMQDMRKEYGETRIIAYGHIDGRLHVLCFKPIARHHIRVISLRKANAKEQKRYGEEAQTIH